MGLQNKVVGLVVSSLLIIIGAVMISAFDDLITGTADWEAFARDVVPLVFVAGGAIGLIMEVVATVRGT